MIIIDYLTAQRWAQNLIIMIASYFTLKGKDESEILNWLDILPIRLRGGQKELILLKSKKQKSILWTRKEGFIFFK